jgi:hypothetical protein
MSAYAPPTDYKLGSSAAPVGILQILQTRVRKGAGENNGDQWGGNRWRLPRHDLGRSSFRSYHTLERMGQTIEGCEDPWHSLLLLAKRHISPSEWIPDNLCHGSLAPVKGRSLGSVMQRWPQADRIDG